MEWAHGTAEAADVKTSISLGQVHGVGYVSVISDKKIR